ncbi:TetR/AcrR family transcriptional regulator [Nocardia sp. CA-135953]|uniref:TetR/AcrR family transcriptional regulator n=1 Tax=Nocardia sp. CA-135953 TaxID=3239978 RepID=UPI003D956E2D
MEGAQTGTTAAGRRGRPRNPDVEDKVFDAAMSVYARDGWAGFTFETIARETGIGKPALYRRWPSRGDLLAQTFRARLFVVDRIDTGNLHDDLLALARITLEHMLSPHGQAIAHMRIDVPRYPEVAESTAEYRESTTAAARQIVRRGIRRDELPPGTPPTLVLDMVVGAAINHVSTMTPTLKPQILSGIDDFAQSLVAAIVRGLGTGRAETPD